MEWNGMEWTIWTERSGFINQPAETKGGKWILAFAGAIMPCIVVPDL